jgi:hypothetical protein
MEDAIVVPTPIGHEIVEAGECTEATRVYTKDEIKRLLRASNAHRAITHKLRRVQP